MKKVGHRPKKATTQVREYRDRFPDKAVVAWHSGVGPIPVLLAGGAQAIMRNPAAGQSQGEQPDRTRFDPPPTWGRGAKIVKPSSEDWLLLLKTK